MYFSKFQLVEVIFQVKLKTGSQVPFPGGPGHDIGSQGNSSIFLHAMPPFLSRSKLCVRQW